jgi:hypothetical protein
VTLRWPRGSRGAAVALAAGLALTMPDARPLGASSASLEIDHVFIVAASDAAAERALLSSGGFTVGGSVTKHTGAGTASVGVLFANAYLELVWVDPSVGVAAAQAANFARTRQRSAWRTSGASPFGIGLRRTPSAPDTLSVEATSYTAPWMRPGTAILTVSEIPTAPALFIVPRYMGLDAWAAELRAKEPDAFRHATGVERLTKVVLAGPGRPAPPVAAAVADVPGVTLLDSPEHGLELTFDEGKQRKEINLRPGLPVVLRY